MIEAPKRSRRASALTMRMTLATRARLDAEAKATGVSVSEMAERLMEAGMFWIAFQRTVMANYDATPSPKEIEAAFRTIEMLKAKAA